MNEKEFIDEWNKTVKKIRKEYGKYPDHYIKIVNNENGEKYAQEYEFVHGDFVLFSIRTGSKQVLVGGEHTKNIKNLSISQGR